MLHHEWYGFIMIMHSEEVRMKGLSARKLWSILTMATTGFGRRRIWTWKEVSDIEVAVDTWQFPIGLISTNNLSGFLSCYITRYNSGRYSVEVTQESSFFSHVRKECP